MPKMGRPFAACDRARVLVSVPQKRATAPHFRRLFVAHFVASAGSLVGDHPRSLPPAIYEERIRGLGDQPQPLSRATCRSVPGTNATRFRNLSGLGAPRGWK